MTRHRLCLVHPVDPRLEPVGTIETRLRAIVASRPNDFELVVVGRDGRGDLALGEPVSFEVAGRHAVFVPVSRGLRTAFAAGLMRHLATVRELARADVASISVHGFAWTALARLVGRPIVLVAHHDPHAEVVAGRVPLPVALREWAALRVADRIVGCDPGFVRYCRERHPDIACKTELLPLALAEDATSPFFPDEVQIARLWERHRRLFDAHAVHRGRHVAA